MSKKPSDKLITQKRKRRPGLHALAKKIGVSHTAVAMALRDDPRISEPLRKRVQKVAREEGYVSSTLAQSLVSGWTGLIGVIVPNVVSTFMARLIQGIIDELWHDGSIALVFSSDLDVDREKRALEAVADKRANGVIISPCMEDRGEDHFIKLLGQHTPIVAVTHPLPCMDVPVVGSDDDLGAQLATRHLIEQGHRHIAHLGCPLDSERADRRRESAYARVMKGAGLEPVIFRAPNRQLGAEELLAVIAAFFGSAPGRRTTAIFAFNDATAYAVYAYARDHGVRIGKDLALIGFGNTQIAPLNATTSLNIIHPGLSTVEQHPHKTGQTAVAVLRRMIDGKVVDRSTLIEPDLLVRESSSTPRTAD